MPLGLLFIGTVMHIFSEAMEAQSLDSGGAYLEIEE